jgi:hypothetical protein
MPKLQERDFPEGHPAASDYTGQAWTNPAAVHDHDFPVGHPARNGGNVREIDRPDGQRAAHLKQSQDLMQLAMIGSLPPLIDPATNDPIELTAEQLAHVYAVRNSLTISLAGEVTERYKLTPEKTRASDVAMPQPTAEEQAVNYLVSLGYLPEKAQAVIAKWGVPEVTTAKLQAEHR